MPGRGQKSCGYGTVTTYAGGDLVDAHRRKLGYFDFTLGPAGSSLARQIAHGDWRILGHSRLRGQRAIKLAETPAGNFKPLPVFLWVSTVTYLPLRMVWLSGSKSGEIDNWYYLPPTKEPTWPGAGRCRSGTGLPLARADAGPGQAGPAASAFDSDECGSDHFLRNTKRHHGSRRHVILRTAGNTNEQGQRFLALWNRR